jgi:hypothetical protein
MALLDIAPYLHLRYDLRGVSCERPHIESRSVQKKFLGRVCAGE